MILPRAAQDLFHPVSTELACNDRVRHLKSLLTENQLDGIRFYDLCPLDLSEAGQPLAED